MTPLEYFSTIDTKQKAYFIGFTVADGCLVTPGKGLERLAFMQKDTDQAVLHCLKEECGATTSVNLSQTFDKRTQKVYSRAALFINAKGIFEVLGKYGIHPRKSFTADKFLHTIPEEFRAAALLGLWDGDGCWTKLSQSRRPNSGVRVSLRGTAPIIEETIEFLGLTNFSITKDYEFVHRLNVWNQEEVLKVYNALYSDPPPFFLDRKYQLGLSRFGAAPSAGVLEQFTSYHNRSRQIEVTSATI